MTAQRTLLVWSVYVLIVGSLLAVVPNAVFDVLDLPRTDEVWIRVVGIVLVLLSLYYYEASRSGSRPFMVATVLGRVFVVAAFVVLWASGEPWQLLLFGAVELVAAIWTLAALRR